MVKFQHMTSKIEPGKFTFCQVLNLNEAIIGLQRFTKFHASGPRAPVHEKKNQEFYGVMSVFNDI